MFSPKLRLFPKKNHRYSSYPLAGKRRLFSVWQIHSRVNGRNIFLLVEGMRK